MMRTPHVKVIERRGQNTRSENRARRRDEGGGRRNAIEKRIEREDRAEEKEWLVIVG